MLIMDPKKAITTIMARRRSTMGQDQGTMPMKNESVKDTDGNLDPRHMAAQDVMAAIHEKSTAKLMEALANFHDMHKMHSEAVPSEDLDEA